MKMIRRLGGLAGVVAGVAFWCGLWIPLAAGQTTRPADAPATQPTGADGAARVQKAEGSVSYSVLQPDGSYGAWQPVKAGDQLSPGTRIRTGLRSRVVLIFGDNTVVSLDRATLASIDQFRRGTDAQQISLGLGHGAVRAGAAETTLRSDLVIQTPTATLSKRGTFGILLEYEPTTGHFRAALSDSGLIAVLNRLTGQQRTVRPGQHVTEAMVRWIETAKFNRWVPVQDVFGLTRSETTFNGLYNTGPGVAEPGGGMQANTLSGRNGSGAAAQALIQGRAALGGVPVVLPRSGGTPLVGRAEGNFGARR